MDKSKLLLSTIINSINELNKVDSSYNFRLIHSMCIEKYQSSLYKYKINEVNDIDSYYFDYVRIRTIELLAEQIKSRNIKGAVAELGVYKGEICSLLNQLLPNRKLYLFDTFSGFTKEQINDKNSIKYTDNSFFEFSSDFSDTSVELVLNEMTTPEKCVVCKGVFPETAHLINDNFCFVSIDVDFYQSTLDALHFFLPRLVKGGYLFIHDYNDDELYGVKEAIKAYEGTCSEIIITVPLPDQCGTVIISK